MIEFIYIFLLSLFTLADGQVRSKDSTEYPTHFRSDDSVLVFKFRGKQFSFRVPKNFVSYYVGFQDVLNTRNAKTLSYLDSRMIDITGDGLADSCVSHIWTTHGEAHIEHLIYSRGQRIWRDRLVIDDDACKGFWSDSSFLTLRPYSHFQVARAYYSQFIEGLVDTSSQSFKKISSMVYSTLSDGKEHNYWKRYLGEFRGRLIGYMDLIDPGIMIWDSRSHRFVQFYRP